jgi:hypothetical protein
VRGAGLLDPMALLVVTTAARRRRWLVAGAPGVAARSASRICEGRRCERSCERAHRKQKCSKALGLRHPAPPFPPTLGQGRIHPRTAARRCQVTMLLLVSRRGWGSGRVSRRRRSFACARPAPDGVLRGNSPFVPNDVTRAGATPTSPPAGRQPCRRRRRPVPAHSLWAKLRGREALTGSKKKGRTLGPRPSSSAHRLQASA